MFTFAMMNQFNDQLNIFEAQFSVQLQFMSKQWVTTLSFYLNHFEPQEIYG